MSGAVKKIETPVRLEYTHVAGSAATRFLRGLAEGRLLGRRCPATGKVYVPPRATSPTHGVPTAEEVEVADRGTVTTFCVVRIPAEGLTVDPPFAAAHILLDGADIPFFHVIVGCEPEAVRMGMRVRAEWAPPAERGPTLASIRGFRPTDEPDADFESYREHL